MTAARSSFRWIALIDLVVCGASFVAALWLFGTIVDPKYSFALRDHWATEAALSSVTAWIGIEFVGGGWRGGVRNWFDLSFCAVGFNLVVQYGLNYFSLVTPVPWPVALGGGILAVGLIGGWRGAFAGIGREKRTILLVGFDAVTAELAVALRERIIGVLEDHPEQIPPGLKPLGDFDGFEEVVAAAAPRSVVFSGRGWLRAISLRRLFQLHCKGVQIEAAPAVFEDVLQRVSWQQLRPVDLLLASPVTGNRSVKTLQAVYTNLAALALLLAAIPVIILLAIPTAIANGGAGFETVTCSGLQRIPFPLLRFRTRRRDGTESWMGRALRTLHVVNLPQLWNVVRGEMGLFGPPPVRTEFAGRLSQLLFAYPHRFAVKPGILGWSQANLSGSAAVSDDALRLGYDLYYAKQQSPSFDIDILLRTLFRAPEAPRRAVDGAK